MTFSRVYTVQPTVTDGHQITIEADLTKGLHAFTIVGLADKAVDEARDRVSAGIKNTGWKSPKQRNQKITIALAPASLKKEGASFDLPIALCYLLASGDIVFDSHKKIFAGELALDGEIRPIRGALQIASTAKRLGYSEVFVPIQNAPEAHLVSGITIYGVRTLKEVIDHIRTDGEQNKPSTKILAFESEPASGEALEETHFVFNDIREQGLAKRGLMIAAAGGHNIALWGPPGTGKTMLARAFREILPPLDEDEALEVTAIHSILGETQGKLLSTPPFRSPHHTASYVSVIGGGTTPKPGEVTLAHHGVLFLDEFPEFDKRVLESLRQPIEEGFVHVARAKGTERFPASFMLIAAMNPCPCGYWGDATKECLCPPTAITKYQRKISGPIVDRIDMWIEVPRMPHDSLAPNRAKKTIDERSLARQSIMNARTHQEHRFEGTSIKKNAHMNVHALDQFIALDEQTKNLLNHSAKQLDLSPRAYHRVIKLARTIADLDESRFIKEDHILEALQYRPKRLFA